MKLSLITCARHRPDKLTDLTTSLGWNTKDPENVEFIFGVEPDDEPVIKVIDRWKKEHPTWDIVLRLWTPEEVKFSVNEKYNILGDMAKNELVSGCGDDLVFVTQNWDEMILKEFEKYPDHIVMTWLNDGPGSEKLPRHYTVHKDWIKLMGVYTVKFLKHYFSDNWQYDIMSAVGRAVYMSHLRVIHRHPLFGNAQVDENHMKDQGLFFIDQGMYNTMKQCQPYEVKKLSEAIAGAV